MYTIANVIFGIPLHKQKWVKRPGIDKLYPILEDVQFSDELVTLIEDEDNGFHSFYHGAADIPPAAFGVYITEFDECSGFVNLNSEITTPTQEHVVKFNELWDALDPDIQDEISSNFGEPRTFILWSTS